MTNQKGLLIRQAGLAPILIVLIIATLVGGYLIYQNQPKLTPSPKPTTQPSPSPAGVIPIPNGSGETATWKTYVDNNYRYSIQYPPTYKLTPSKISGNNFIIPAYIKGDLSIVISHDTNPQYLSVKAWVDKRYAASKKAFLECGQNSGANSCGHGPPTVYTEKEIIVDNIKSLYQDTEEAPAGRTIKVYIPNNNIVLTISMSVMGISPIDQESLQKFNQILSTFKFTD